MFLLVICRPRNEIKLFSLAWKQILIYVGIFLVTTDYPVFWARESTENKASGYSALLRTFLNRMSYYYYTRPCKNYKQNPIYHLKFYFTIIALHND